MDEQNKNKLFVLIVDECHVGIKAHQAHDMIVNDFSWGDKDQAQRSKCDKSGMPHASSGMTLLRWLTLSRSEWSGALTHGQ